jgi:hypothetical protein
MMDDPDFLLEAPTRAMCAAFIKEGRMKFREANKLDRKSGGSPATALEPPSATLLTLSQNRRLQPLPQSLRQLINLMIPVNLDRLLRRPHGDDAMFASLEMGLQVGYQASRHLVIQKITELRQKL